MPLTDLIHPRDFLVGLESLDKWDAISRLMSHLVESGRITPEQLDPLHEHVLARERSMSTGMEHGIAIPHAAVGELEEVVCGVGLVAGEEGLNFESIDARPTHVVVLLLIPRAQKLLHIRTLADIARVLSRDEVREALAKATDGDEAWSILSRSEGVRPV
jgi:mannitol/fructose-specific phosphotransferase system IIA component (Ntr-type)